MRISHILPAALATALIAAGCDTATSPESPDPLQTQQLQEPVTEPILSTSEIVPGHYIVILHEGAALPSDEHSIAKVAREHAVRVNHIYANSIHGFSGEMSNEAAMRLAADPTVKLIEPDRRINIATEGKGNGSDGAETLVQSTPWGIDYVGGAGDGTGKVAWIIDTGIDLDHPDLNVDVTRSRNFARRAKNADDGNGHGTHVAGTIAAKNNTSGVVGVAADASVVAVRVLDSRGSGYYSDIIAGVNYVAQTGASGDVANMSLGGPASTSLDDAVRALAATGVKVVVAAGNDGADCSSQSPARVNATNVYTVSAIGTNGCLATWSNYGLPVDYAAPGVGVLSTWRGGGTRTISGTSMAAPHVAGIALLGAINSLGTACSDRDAVADPLAKR